MVNKLNDLLNALQKNRILIWLLIILITLIWGYAWVLMKASLNYMGPFTFSAFRFTIGAITLLLVIWLLKTGFPPRKYIKHIVIIGLLQTSAVFLLVMYGLLFVGAGKSSVILYSMPLFSSLLALKFLGEKINTAKMIGLLMGLAGLVTILGWDIFIGQPREAIYGQLLIVLAAIAWSISNVYYRLKVQHLQQLQVSALQMTFGALGIIAAAVLMEWNNPVVLNTESIYYVLFTGVLASALCFTAWFVIISLIDMVTATISTLLVPIFGLFFSSLILNEELTPGVIAGSALIISGIMIAQIKKRKHSSRDQEDQATVK
ncbi:DMT family transporter [Virgibacillus sp. YIM 98842]|uniref:DMT family transporter n=1 Tax=Virgibacillus sp. YIM 98842 TaxID=2663533 RepID=UPI0013DAC415|nr:DMT family transporter [Virgibacillus sp. YIM 98842]